MNWRNNRDTAASLLAAHFTAAFQIWLGLPFNASAGLFVGYGAWLLFCHWMVER